MLNRLDDKEQRRVVIRIRVYFNYKPHFELIKSLTKAGNKIF